MEVNFNNPIYDIVPSLPQERQEPWAALVDMGAVASIAPQSCVPRIPIKAMSETLTSVNGGNFKVLSVKHVAFITGKIIIHVSFLIVEDVKNPIIGLDAIYHNRLQVHLHEKRKVHSSTTSVQGAVLHYHQNHYYASGVVLPDHVQSHHLRWSDSQYTTLDNQSASNIIAEIDDKIMSDLRKIILEEENQEDLSQQAQVPQCLKVPSTPSSAERELHELTRFPFRSWCEICQRTKGLHCQHKHQSQEKSSVIQLDHSFYKIPGSVQNLKALTFIETSTSMCGAVIVPDLQISLEANPSSSSLWSMCSLIVFFNAMVTQVSCNFKISLAKIFHCLLKSVPHIDSKVRELWKGVRSGRSSGSRSSHPSHEFHPKASFEASASEALLIVVGEMHYHLIAHCGS